MSLRTMSQGTRNCRFGLGFLIAVLAAGPLAAVTEPEASSSIVDLAFQHPGFYIRSQYLPVEALPPELAEEARRDLIALGVDERHGYLDVRGGRWGTLILTQPLIPGGGVGNDLSWRDLGFSGPPDVQTLEVIAWEALVAYIRVHEAEFELEVSQLGPPRITVHDAGDLIQITAPRTLDGIPVRDSYLSASIKMGNLILTGAHGWGDLDPDLPSRLALSADDATAKVADYLAAVRVTGFWGETELSIVPLAAEPAGDDDDSGKPRDDGSTPDDGDPRGKPAGGYDYRLAWTVRPEVEGDPGRWQVLIDGTSGEVLAFEDAASYQHEVVGGAYPLTNDGSLPGGVELTAPMPYADLSDGSMTTFADGAGYTAAFPTSSTVGTMLAGQFVQIFDSCGAINETTSSSVLDLGTNNGTDCASAGTSPGNTHAARTSYYELNRIQEMGRGQLPLNTWLRGLLPANTNVTVFPPACGASWSGLAVTFLRSQPGCANTGELATVIDHEFGHGLDENDANRGLSSPGEGIADAYSFLRSNESCIARGYRPGTTCGGYGDPCVSCDGVRDVDFAGRASGQPHDVAWISNPMNCTVSPRRNGPCGFGVHCESAVTGETMWDLWNRDLRAPPFGLDFNTALEMATRLTYLGGGAVDEWYECSVPYGGCHSDGGYLNFLTVDDDDGTLANGTPRMSAIHAAFDRHGIACRTPAVMDSGCAGAPAAAPVVSALPRDRAVDLTWNVVPGASSYRVFRTEGVFGCGYGKTLIAEVGGTAYTDPSLTGGRNYFYVVIPVGVNPTCSGPASSCTPATPMPPPVPATNSTCGDCDGDGGVTILDALVAANHAAGVTLVTGPGMIDCDVDRSGDVTSIDALLIAQEAAGLAPGLACIPCGDCDNDGVPRQLGDLDEIRNRVSSDVVTSQDAACDTNGDRRIDARDVVDFSTTPFACVTCGDSNTDGAVDGGDPLLPVPFPFAPGTRPHAATDNGQPVGVNILDALRIANYVAGLSTDLVCLDPSAGSPRPRLIYWQGSYCVTGTSNGTPFSATLDATVPGAVGPLTPPPGQRDAAGLAALWQAGINMNPDYRADPATGVSGHCFDVTDLAGSAPVNITVDGTCDPEAIPTGCPFG